MNALAEHHRGAPLADSRHVLRRGEGRVEPRLAVHVSVMPAVRDSRMRQLSEVVMILLSMERLAAAT